jgi:hypothetical protein
LDPIMQSDHGGFIPLIEGLSEDLVALRRFFIRHKLQLRHISGSQDERGTRLSQHRGQTTTVKPGTAGEEDDFVLEGEEIERHERGLLTANKTLI